MIQIIKKLRVLLDKKQKRTMVGLIILMVISAFLQTAGVGMLVEVMQIVIDPEAVQHSRVAEACYEIMGVESYRTFSIIVMVLLILIFVVKNLFTYFQRYHDDPDGGGIASVDVADQESAEAHHVQGR